MPTTLTPDKAMDVHRSEGESARRRSPWIVLREPALFAALSAIIAGVISFIIPPVYLVRSSLTLSSISSQAMGGSILGLARQFGLSPQLGSDNPDIVVALFSSRVVLEAVVTHRFPRETYAGIWWTDCEKTGADCDLLHVWRIDGKNTRDSIERAAEKLDRAVSASANPRSGIVTVTVKAGGPDLALAILTRMLIIVDSVNAQIQRREAHEQVAFIDTQVSEARSQLRQAESTLVAFDFRNRAIQSSPGLLQERARLDRDVNLAETFYVELASALRQAYIAAANNVSTMTVIDTPRLPGRRDWPKRRIIVVIGFVLGLLAWSTRRFGRTFVDELRAAIGMTATRS
jgi:uncharacterized protein involved in exopolysaccharide biosynthesis